MGAAEAGEGFRYKNGGSEGGNLGYHLSSLPRISDGMGPGPRGMLPLDLIFGSPCFSVLLGMATAWIGAGCSWH